MKSSRFALLHGTPNHVDSCSVEDYVTIHVAANLPPTAAATANPATVHVGDQVWFDGSGSSDPEGAPLAYAWDFGDGTTSTEPNPVHEYTAPGTYTPSITVSDGQASASASLTIAVSPTIQFSVRTASVKWWNRHKTMGMVHVWADLTAPVPLGAELVRVTFDGVVLLSEPISGFQYEPWTGVYLLAKRGLVARLDLTRGRLFVLTPRINLIGLDTANGVDVTVSVGAATVVENIRMSEAPGDRLIYRRSGTTDEP